LIELPVIEFNGKYGKLTNEEKNHDYFIKFETSTKEKRQELWDDLCINRGLDPDETYVSGDQEFVSERDHGPFQPYRLTWGGVTALAATINIRKSRR
jgi:hypothetical protein